MKRLAIATVLLAVFAATPTLACRIAPRVPEGERTVSVKATVWQVEVDDTPGEEGNAWVALARTDDAPPPDHDADRLVLAQPKAAIISSCDRWPHQWYGAAPAVGSRFEVFFRISKEGVVSGPIFQPLDEAPD